MKTNKNLKPGIDYIGVGCGALIINDKNETLLLKRTSKTRNQAGLWSKPGGAVEFGEKIEDAVKREVREEIGVDIELIKSLGFTNHYMNEEKQHWLSLNYLAKITNGEPKNLEPEKHEEMKWFRLDDLPPNIAENTSKLLNEYQKF